jgi:hypothetical protein
VSVNDPIIQLRGAELLTQLSAQGWRLIAREEAGPEWRIAAIWVIESDWTPQGFRLYLAFLTDPLLPSQVWALSVSSTYPTGAAALADAPLIQLRNVWGKELPGFLDAIAALRAQATASGAESTVE